MTQILNAIVRAFRDLFQFKVLWIVIWPMLVAAFLWMILGVVFWSTFSGWIASGLTFIGIQEWLEGLEPRWVANVIQVTAHLILFIPLVFTTALLITAFFAMPALIRLVADRDYPQLKRENGGNNIANLLNAVLAIGVFIAIWVLSLPLWIIGIGVIVPFVAAAYLNQRLFRFDAVAEHATSEEMKSMFSTYQSSWWGLGLLTGLLQFVPILNLFAPVLTALAFIHFGLARLTSLRQAS
ncbi:EI24 domain-containing protein [Candidatus Nitrotoga sp. M5]|uniref:EI24 domain-containing protein n=1 Tax=Candidatus Nitrotoga sp. M5 TaxID=2890409 RepID=UPI001EF6EC98|nr:EI24 domain-containing protein [Candidatus Nitrotoga sp. M5]CAH1388157.1 Membrane protein [Candidatus Nitrotoga sp. M5]